MGKSTLFKISQISKINLLQWQMTEELWYLTVKDGSDFLLKIDINIYLIFNSME